MIDTIKVYANPHHAHDHNGEPAAAVPFVDENGAVHVHRFVGAVYHLGRSGAQALGNSPVLVAVKGARTKVSYPHPDDEKQTYEVEHVGEGRIVFDFDDEPVTVPFAGAAKDYYARRVQAGELLAADEASAKKCGVEKFGPPECEHEACAPYELPKPVKTPEPKLETPVVVAPKLTPKPTAPPASPAPAAPAT